jgi:hypothetical protein
MKQRRNLPDDDYDDTPEDLEQEEEMDIIEDKPRSRGRPPKTTHKQAPQPKQEVAEWQPYLRPPVVGIYNPSTKEFEGGENMEQAQLSILAKIYTMVEKIANTI